ncbi:unnamed protein product, partial [Discosporangium mesarthrocarpum]
LEAGGNPSTVAAMGLASVGKGLGLGQGGGVSRRVYIWRGSESSAQMLGLMLEGVRWLRDYEGWGVGPGAMPVLVDEGHEPQEFLEAISAGPPSDREPPSYADIVTPSSQLSGQPATRGQATTVAVSLFGATQSSTQSSGLQSGGSSSSSSSMVSTSGGAMTNTPVGGASVASAVPAAGRGSSSTGLTGGAAAPPPTPSPHPSYPFPYTHNPHPYPQHGSHNQYQGGTWVPATPAHRSRTLSSAPSPDGDGGSGGLLAAAAGGSFSPSPPAFSPSPCGPGPSPAGPVFSPGGPGFSPGPGRVPGVSPAGSVLSPVTPDISRRWSLA